MPLRPMTAGSGSLAGRQLWPAVARSKVCSVAAVEFMWSAVTSTSRVAVASGAGQLCAKEDVENGGNAAAARTQTIAARLGVIFPAVAAFGACRTGNNLCRIEQIGRAAEFAGDRDL